MKINNFLSPPRRRGSSIKNWIPAFAGMTEVVFMVMMTANPSSALELKQKKSNAGLPGEWLSLFASGAREAGMAGASVALYGLGSSYSNPAGLAQGRLGEASFMTAPLFAGAQYHALSFSQPLSPRRYLSMTLLSLTSGEAERTDALGQSRGSFKSQDTAFLFSMGQAVTENWNGGFNLKAVKQSLADRSDSSFGLDVGAQTSDGEGLGFGWSVMNLLAPSLKLDQTAERYPLEIKAGPRYGAPFGMVTAQVSYLDPGGAKVLRWSSGIEWKILGGRLPIYFRGGINQREIASGFGAGAGSVSFDYAAVFQELGMLHRFGVVIRYGYLSPGTQARIDREWRLLKEKEEQLRLAAKQNRLAEKTEGKAVHAPAEAGGPPDDFFEEELKQARRYLDNGNYEKCGKFLERLEQRKPGEPRVAALRRELLDTMKRLEGESELRSAQIYYDGAEYSRAIASARRALAVLLESPEARRLILMSEAQISIQASDFRSAQEKLRQAVEMNPDNEEAVYLFRKINSILEATEANDE